MWALFVVSLDETVRFFRTLCNWGRADQNNIPNLPLSIREMLRMNCDPDPWRGDSPVALRTYGVQTTLPISNRLEKRRNLKTNLKISVLERFVVKFSVLTGIRFFPAIASVWGADGLNVIKVLEHNADEKQKTL